MKEYVEIKKRDFWILKLGLVSSGLANIGVFFDINENEINLTWNNLFFLLFFIYAFCNIYLIVCDCIERKKER